MSLELTNGTVPDGLRVKTYGDVDGTVHIGTYEISLEDFLATALYVLVNTDLAQHDPRLEFIDVVKSLEEVQGWHPAPGSRRLAQKG